MCFSAQASFIAAAGTGAIGVATFHRDRSTTLRWLALVPGFFALQQASEGLVWLHLKGIIDAAPLDRIAQSIFLTFALVFWPTYAPLAVMMSERMRFRRILCSVALVSGLSVSLFNASHLIGLEAPVVLGHSIKYGYGDGYLSWRLFYGIVSLSPLFISSLRRMWILGSLALLGFVISDSFYYEAFVSVWCFYAAVISMVLYFILRENEEYSSIIVLPRVEDAANAI